MQSRGGLNGRVEYEWLTDWGVKRRGDMGRVLQVVVDGDGS